MFRKGNIRALLLDIEGTTTPVEFVYEVLFPYARERVEEFVQLHERTKGVSDDIEGLRREHAADVQKNLDPPPWAGAILVRGTRAGGGPDAHTRRSAESSGDSQVGSVVSYVRWLMDQDRKSTALKSLQGKIWRDGYRHGELQGRVYPDVRPAFERWKQQDRKLFIYSSGSVLAQKLLFGSSTAGDLTQFISGYFDTNTGPKKEKESYRTIAADLGLPPGQVLFVSDVVGELDAAKLAGMQTALCVRSGAVAPDASEHPVIQTFDGLFP